MPKTTGAPRNATQPMKLREGIRNFFHRLDLDTRLTVFGLAFLLLTWLMDFFRFGPSFERFSFVFQFVLVLVFFILVLSDRLRLERKLLDVIDSRLPGLEFIRGAERVEYELTKAASDARRFIVSIGGESRITKYLETIARKVVEEQVPYTRIIIGDHIHHELCAHLCSLLEQRRVHVAHALKEKSSMALVTDNVLIFTSIPSTSPEVFDTIVKVPDPKAAEEYREYFVDLLFRSARLNAPEQIKGLCVKCRANP